MKYISQYNQLTLEAFRSSLDGLNKDNRWVKLGDNLPWDIVVHRRIQQGLIVALTTCAVAVAGMTSRGTVEFLAVSTTIPESVTTSSASDYVSPSNNFLHKSFPSHHFISS